MHYKIILEGADNVGKSRIARTLAEYFGYDLIHCSAPSSMDSAKTEYFNWLDADKNIIFDRYFIGEMVYAPLFRGYTPDYFDEFEKYAKVIKDQKLLYIMLYSPEGFLEYKDEDDKKIANMHNQIQGAFIKQFNRITHAEKYIFNIANFANLQEEETTIIQFVNDWMEGKLPNKKYKKFYYNNHD